MKRIAIKRIGQILYSKKIKHFEDRYRIAFRYDWVDKSFEDYAKDIFKAETETIELIEKSTGSKRMEFTCGLQALYNICESELDFVYYKVSGFTQLFEYSEFFGEEYSQIYSQIKNLSLDESIEQYVECGKILKLVSGNQFFTWRQVNACLILHAVDEIHGDSLNDLMKTLRGLD